MPGTAKVFLSHQIKALSGIYDLTLVANLQGQPDPRDWLPESVKVVDIPIQRKIQLFHDIKALYLLFSFFNKSRYSLVHSITPKAGLLTMLASWFVRIPVRLHTFTGQVWVTKNRFAKILLKQLDKLTASLTTLSLVEGYYQREFLIKNNIISELKSSVFGDGPIGGINLERFKEHKNTRIEVRAKLGISSATIVLLYVGRINEDKGIIELLNAFSSVHSKNKDTALWIIGNDEGGFSKIIEQNRGVYLIPYTQVPENYMAAGDILCIPSYNKFSRFL